MPIRAVVFDLFDTLVDLELETLPRVEHRGRAISVTAPRLHAAVAGRCDVGWDDFVDMMFEVDGAFVESHYKQGRELPTIHRFEALVRRMGLTDDDLPELLTGIHMGAIREQVRVPSHHAEVIARLAERARLGVCSNFSHSETALRVLDEGALREPFDAIVISDVHGLRKPRREIFEATLEELGAAPGETLHVGDSLSADVAGAAALGIRTAWITRRVGDPESRLRDFDGAPPDARVADLSEIAELLDAL